MRYQNAELKEKLAAEYVLGTLHGRARARFSALMKYDSELRRIVSKWEDHLFNYNFALTEVMPSPDVWEKISAQIKGKTRGSSISSRISKLGLWVSFASIASVASLVLGIYLATLPKPEVPMSMLAVLQDHMANPTMMVSWPKNVTEEAKVKIQVIIPATEIAKDASWEMWAVPTDKSAPTSLGVITTDAEQILYLPEKARHALHNATAIAISVEPHGGSPTGYPTGPVIYKGAAVPIS